MNRIAHCFIALAIFGVSRMSYADQLAYLSLEEAELAQSYLEHYEDPVLIACYCCDDPAPTWTVYSNVDIRDTGRKNNSGEPFYEVVLITPQGERKLDLAYTHVDVWGQRMALGKVLNMDCDPCTMPSDILRFVPNTVLWDGVDVTDWAAIESQGWFEFEQTESARMFNNIMARRGTMSYGEVVNLEVDRTAASEESYAIDALTFQWNFANSYDNDTGVCDMELSIFYEEYDTNFILYMTLPNGEIHVYKGFVSGP